jgi:hypothetical protein
MGVAQGRASNVGSWKARGAGVMFPMGENRDIQPDLRTNSISVCACGDIIDRDDSDLHGGRMPNVNLVAR